jgi:uncharacterized protein YjiS (DUF1127 family)
MKVVLFCVSDDHKHRLVELFEAAGTEHPLDQRLVLAARMRRLLARWREYAQTTRELFAMQRSDERSLLLDNHHAQFEVCLFIF